MRSFIWYLIIFVIFCIPLTSQAAIIGYTDEQVRQIAEPVLDNILNGFVGNDYNQYSKDFNDTFKNTVSLDKFPQIRQDILDRIGNYLYREYLGFINRQSVTIVFWKAMFGKTQNEVLIKLVISDDDGKYLVTGFWVQ